MKSFILLIIFSVTLCAKGQTNYFSTTISSDSDDAEENISGGGIDLTSSDLEMTHDNGVLGVGSKDQWIGIRFTNIDIPKDAHIDSVFIQFTVKSEDTDPAVLQLHGDKFFNSSTFSDLDYNISSRTQTDTSVYWTVPNWDSEDESGPKQRTPNLAGIIKEIITQSLWQQGNAVSFMVEGSGRRSAFSYDNDSQKAARLHIYYRENTASVSEENNNEVSIFPNPSDAEFFVDLREFDKQEDFQLTFISLEGKVIAKRAVEGGTLFSTSSFLTGYKGLLTVLISSKNRSFSHRQLIR